MQADESLPITVPIPEKHPRGDDDDDGDDGGSGARRSRLEGTYTIVAVGQASIYPQYRGSSIGTAWTQGSIAMLTHIDCFTSRA